MKIIEHIDNGKLFRDIRIGDIFEWNKKYYMKTATIQVSDGSHRNAVAIDDGQLTHFNEAQNVNMVQAEMDVSKL